MRTPREWLRALDVQGEGELKSALIAVCGCPVPKSRDHGNTGNDAVNALPHFRWFLRRFSCGELFRPAWQPYRRRYSSSQRVAMAEGLRLVNAQPDPHSTKLIAEVTLVWVLFADASRVRFSACKQTSDVTFGFLPWASR